VEPTSSRPSAADPRPQAAAEPGAAPGSIEVSPSAAGCEGFYTARDARNQRRFNLWLCAAVLVYLGATAALRWRASMPGSLAWLPWLLVGCASILAILATRSYLVFLRAADELLRRVQTEAMALGFGAGAVFSLLYPLFERLGAPVLAGEMTAVVMMISCAAGAWLGTRRYSGGMGA
jgi:hypothetical protein